MTKTIHLYWGSRFQSPRAERILAETSIGIALCAARVPRFQLTLSPTDTTCPLCRKLHRQQQPKE
jgi:hypothetical protein